ncbi:hypothetical protein [Streptomyces sp. NBC_00525]|uniref:hypothetical protein n=1 Tax=Streptomyces sp. NBC_00525 TaxID=2903660 RepID=UPI002E80E899|nr:hypothetical protein [Streptomyces sp. NBC_00525]WUC95205.1 hypothetical protein OG710_17145 [Streptomyces sp. NBC_00525]
MLNDIRQLRKIVRRRDVLRYGGIGLLTVALAACGKDKKGADGSLEAPGSAGRPAAKPTVTGAALEAFVSGAWNLSYEPRGQVNDEYRRIEFTGRRWSLDGDDETGSYELNGSGLVVRFDGRDTDNVWAASGLPATVGERASLTIRWGLSAESGEVDPGSPVDTTATPLPVVWDGGKLRIEAADGLLITAVRA